MTRKRNIERVELDWVLSVIESCDTPFQLEATREIINLFYKRENDIDTKEKIEDKFHTQAIKVNYYHHKAIKDKENIRA